MIMVLARNWWALALRGLVSIVFGVIAFAVPGPTLSALLLLFAVYAFVDGIFAIVAAVRAAERHERWWPMLIEGVAGILLAVVTFIRPAVTLIFLVSMVSAWAIVTGVMKVVVAIRLRRHIQGELVHVLNGVISVLFGLFLLLIPGIGLLAIVWWIAGYAVFRGLLLCALSYRLWRHHRRAVRPPGARVA